MDITEIDFLSDTAQIALAEDLIKKDWQPVWCSFWPGGKFAPVPGTTGSVPYPTVVPPPPGARKLGFRVPLNVVVIDVDAYDGKHGDESLERAEEWLGELPPTWRVTSRGYSNLSGRYLFRKPVDLDFTESALWQFREPEEDFGIEILRTTHRFSWAAGEIHYKTNELIKCWDDVGTVCPMPYVHELPELPRRWVDYLRNPPVPVSLSAYQRPADGPKWWLEQPDASLSTDEELKGFAWDMLLSRVPVEEIWEQWQRVSHSVNPGWPWDRSDFDRHVRSRAQAKVDEILAHEDQERDDLAYLAGGEDKLREKYEQAVREYENPRELVALVTEQPLLPQGDDLERMVALQPQLPDPPHPTRANLAEKLIKGKEKYNELLFQAAAKEVLKRDVARLFADEFTDWEDISDLPEPEAPAFLNVTGRGRLIPPNTVTVMSGARASGKTWATATWAAQEIRAGGHVIWIDFERQAHALASKLRILGVPQHMVQAQVHYVGGTLPSSEYTVAYVRKYRREGNGRVLMVVDAFRGLQNYLSPGTSANDGDAVETVYLQYLNPVAARDAGATVVVIDHVTKTGLGGTFGSERKESAADYVVKVVQQKPFSRYQAGYATLEITKDRYGHHSAGTIAAALWVPLAGEGKRTPDLTGMDAEEIRSIREYPDIPELRSWVPDGDGSLEQWAEGGQAGGGQPKGDFAQVKLDRETVILAAVHANPLRYTQSALAAELKLTDPELFGIGEASIRTNILDKMVKAGLLAQDSGKRLEIGPAAVIPEKPVRPAPVALEHPDGEEASE